MVAVASTSRLHEASLVDASLHAPALLELIDIAPSKAVNDYIIDTVVTAVDFALGRPSITRGRSTLKTAAFATFVENVLTRAEVTVPTIISALVYIDRAMPHLHIALEEWACERVFLGAIMVASKYTNDSTLKNVHWAMCTGVFGRRDVGRIEREMLDVLDWELALSEDDLLAHHAGLFAHTRPAPPTHQHRRTHSRAASVESASTTSSMVSTPETLVDESMDVIPKHLSIDLVSSESASKKTRLNFAQSTMELIRSFPIPHSQSRPKFSHSTSRPRPVMVA